MINTFDNLNRLLNGSAKLSPKARNSIKEILREKTEQELKEIQSLNNPVANLIVMQVMYERKASIKI